MNILGINYWGHDASAALLTEQGLAAAIEEERFTRFNKHFGGFPYRSIEFCLQTAGLSAGDIDHAGYYIDPRELLSSKGISYAFKPWYGIGNKMIYVSRLLYLLNCGIIKIRIERKFGPLKKNIKMHFVRHHDSHLASAFYPSGFEEADIISVDGIGEWETTVKAVGRGNSIERLGSAYFPHSIGLLFSAVTRHLGFTVNNDEYKVMGLAGYGDSSRYMGLMKDIIRFTGDGMYEIDTTYISPRISWGHVSKKFIRESGLAARVPDSELRQEHMDMAAAIQKITEDLGVHIARSLQRETGGKRICLSGGVALNCIMNARILEDTPYEDIFVQPAAYDASGSIGSALWIKHAILDEPRSYQMKHVFYGFEPEEKDISDTLNSFNGSVTFARSDNVAADTAQEIADQKIVGWYQGRMEWGPRALGNRSILADARNPKMVDIVNDKVKHREDFRPFAPSVKKESYSEYFDFPVPSPFMLLICKVKQDKREVIPAVTHFDGTSRYHTVEQEHNPLYWTLIDEFEKITGVPVVLNTSFNMNGETMVMTPKDAVECFLGTGIDVLVMGNYIVKKNGDL
ncbi:carbamoyltransferase [Candidatus Auribacterota bacterium]